WTINMLILIRRYWLKRQVLDVEVEISFKRPNYNGKSKTIIDNESFRLVAVYNEDDGNYHVYLTNISKDDLTPEDVAKLYGARWDIELIFKELKSRYDLDVVNTKNPQIVEAYIWIAILTLFISRRIYNIVRKHNPKEKMVRYTQLRWSTIFTENASDQLTLILRYYGVERTFETVMNVYQSQALDPHVNRERFRDEWWS
ncbi:MAG: transposase, partial [Candidatus Methanoperedens sp.]|nr:transposase [Candidatus Methanoperedens sp.]